MFGMLDYRAYKLLWLICSSAIVRGPGFEDHCVGGPGDRSGDPRAGHYCGSWLMPAEIASQSNGVNLLVRPTLYSR
jgi:hypothetical protein